MSSDVGCRDYFRSVLEDRSFYGRLDVFQYSLAKYEGILRSGSLCTEEAIDLELALLRVRRCRGLLTANVASDRLAELRPKVENNDDLLMKLEMITAEFELHQCGESGMATQKLEAIITRLDDERDSFLYGLVANDLAVAYLALGDLSIAEEYCQDSMSIFRRMGYELLYAFSLANYGVMKKKSCEYMYSLKCFVRSAKMLQQLGALDATVVVCNDVAVTKLKMGDWRGAEYYLAKARRLRNRLGSVDGLEVSHGKNENVNLMHLRVMQRRFSEAVSIARDLEKDTVVEFSKRNKTLMEEFLGECDLETKRLLEARKHLSDAAGLSLEIAPQSDLMTEIMRRQAQLYLLEGELVKSRKEALSCIKLCRKITDKHEMGAALRILAQVYAQEGLDKKAASTFEVSIHLLKSIGECYELMRSCIAYGEFLIDCESEDADIYLLEARQLCRKLEIDFYKVKISLLVSKYAYNEKDYTAAQTELRRAEEICDGLQECDRRQLEPELRKFYKMLERAILQSSMQSAKKLKSLGEIYEDARFPIEELKPELALKVARNVGAESLFLAKRKGKGYAVPMKYNISVSEAKGILRREREAPMRDLFAKKAPTVCLLRTGKTLVAVPGQDGAGYVLCTVIDSQRQLTPRELEFLFASVNAMERVAEEYAQTPFEVEGSDFIEDRGLQHPGGYFKDIVTLDPAMIKLIRLAERASGSTVPILLEGGTGVGKELFARAIYSQSPRKNRAFVAINTGGVPISLLESQLFGHLKGAFTDAVSDRTGLVEEARSGTLFLDEVGEMCEAMQVKLLRLLENGEYRRLGENRVRQADVRVISATNKDLEGRVAKGAFREDLYYRLATVKLEIPPLRDRRRDIEFLIRHFLREGLVAIGRPRRRIHVDMKALEALELYDWPGNVRELKNEILRNLSLIGEGEVIRYGMLSDRIKAAFQAKSEGGDLGARVERFERRLILKALEDNDWNRHKTAEQIGIPRTTLLFKMKRLAITA